MLMTKNASAKGLDYIRQFEKFEPVPYPDVAGKMTIGYGHLILPGEHFTSITKAEAESLFKKDVGIAERAINRLVKVPLSQNQYDALTSLVFNIGIGAFESSTILRKINVKDYAGASAEFPRWKYAGGTEVRGLLNRRLAEQATWVA